jgi:FkbM family methyltransferase
VDVRIAGGDLEGYIVRLDMQVDKDLWLGTYESELQAAVHHLVPHGAVIYDVGANIGYISLLLAKAAGEGGSVFAFEALPSNIERLRHNLVLNGLESRVQVVPRAVIGSGGHVRFLVHASNGMGRVAGSAGRDEAYRDEIVVPGISLDEFVFGEGNPPPQVIKMDIEGGEVLALPGMHRVLAECRPFLLMELHGRESCQAAWDILPAHGYRLQWMRRGHPPVRSADELGTKAYIIALPGLPTKMADERLAGTSPG